MSLCFTRAGQIPCFYHADMSTRIPPLTSRRLAASQWLLHVISLLAVMDTPCHVKAHSCTDAPEVNSRITPMKSISDQNTFIRAKHGNI